MFKIEKVQFSFECENCGAVPYLERYLIPQCSRRIVKIFLENSRFCYGILIS